MVDKGWYCHTRGCDNFGFDNPLSYRVLAVGHDLGTFNFKRKQQKEKWLAKCGFQEGPFTEQFCTRRLVFIAF
jgi:hypothetical protein